MGANSAMYDFLREKLQFEINFINWPKYSGEKTYSAVAERFIADNGIRDDDIVGGSSLGGMVALEIARQKKLRAVILIGSAISPSEIRGILSLLAPVSVITPISFVQLLAGKHEDIIARMFSAADPDFIRAMCQYLPKWSGALVESTPIFRIHGQNDYVIPCPKTGCEIIVNAGHLLAITHAKECGQYLNKINRQLLGWEH